MFRAEESLARDVVKHLQRIEEQVLESRAWVTDSPLWEALEKEGGVPSCEEVSLPGGGKQLYLIWFFTIFKPNFVLPMRTLLWLRIFWQHP